MGISDERRGPTGGVHKLPQPIGRACSHAWLREPMTATIPAPTLPLAALAAAARAVDGLFLLADALDHGVTARVISRLVREGVVERVHHGVYRFTAVPWSWQAKQRAAVLAAGPGACASYTGAARWLGIDGVAGGRPEVSVLQKDLHIDFARVHRTRSLEACDVTEVRRLRCTTGSRTLIDLAGRLDRVRLIAAADAAICAGIASRNNLLRRARALRAGRRGVAPLIEITEDGAEGVFWSALERRFGELVARSGLPTPRYNTAVEHGGRTLYPDALWKPAGVVAELQGLAFHRTPAERERDDERRNAFAEMELRVLVFGWQQVTDRPDEVISTLRSALGQRYS